MSSKNREKILPSNFKNPELYAIIKEHKPEPEYRAGKMLRDTGHETLRLPLLPLPLLPHRLIIVILILSSLSGVILKEPLQGRTTRLSLIVIETSDSTPTPITPLVMNGKHCNKVTFQCCFSPGFCYWKNSEKLCKYENSKSSSNLQKIIMGVNG